MARASNNAYWQAFMTGYNLAMSSIERVAKAHALLAEARTPEARRPSTSYPVMQHTDASEKLAEGLFARPEIYDNIDGLGK